MQRTLFKDVLAISVLTVALFVLLRPQKRHGQTGKRGANGLIKSGPPVPDIAQYYDASYAATVSPTQIILVE